MTLLEVLAVIVIVTLIMATVSMSLAAADSGAQFLKALSTLRDVDARARIYARTSGSAIQMSVNEDRLQCSVAGNVIFSEQLPPDITVQVIDRAGVNHITIDRQGRSDDYEVVISSGSSGRTRQWLMGGFTAFATEKEPKR